jgi:outer membrane receptor protein involved in Fe transport
MGYVTVSEGYRIGASNGVGACKGTDGNQNVCAQPDELQYLPDKTTNYEVGLRTQWLDRRLTLNGDVYYIKWKDPQLASATKVGAQPITKNGKGAETRGFELSLSAQVTEAFGLDVGYGYTKAELTDDAPSLLRTFTGSGFGADNILDFAGLSGDRLPGSPEQQGTFHMKYAFPLANGWNLDMNYGFAAIGNILTRTGERANGEVLPGYTVHQAWATLKADQWSVALYADNLTNKFARTGVRGDTSYLQTVKDDNGDARLVRTYYHDVLRPRQVGLRFTYDFAFR